MGYFSLITGQVLQQIKNGKGNNSQLGFCIHVVLAIAFHPSCQIICFNAIDKLKEVLQVALSNEFVNSLSDEILFSLNNIVLTLIQLHADAKMNLLKYEFDRREISRQN